MSTRTLTEDDYKFDTDPLLRAIGVDPATVKPGTVKMTFPNGIAVIEYEVVRAVPPRLLGVAFLQGSNITTEAPDQPEPDPHLDPTGVWVVPEDDQPAPADPAPSEGEGSEPPG